MVPARLAGRPHHGHRPTALSTALLGLKEGPSTVPPHPQTTTATACLLPSRSSTAASNRFARRHLLPWPARSATSLTKPRVEVGVRTFHLPFPLPTPASGHLYRTAHGRRRPATAMAAVLLPAGPLL